MREAVTHQLVAEKMTSTAWANDLYFLYNIIILIESHRPNESW